jgi:hypothetical protein
MNFMFWPFYIAYKHDLRNDFFFFCPLLFKNFNSRIKHMISAKYFRIKTYNSKTYHTICVKFGQV